MKITKQLRSQLTSRTWPAGSLRYRPTGTSSRSYRNRKHFNAQVARASIQAELQAEEAVAALKARIEFQDAVKRQNEATIANLKAELEQKDDTIAEMKATAQQNLEILDDLFMALQQRDERLAQLNQVLAEAQELDTDFFRNAIQRRDAKIAELEKELAGEKYDSAVRENLIQLIKRRMRTSTGFSDESFNKVILA
ncbi:hypothetical protein BJ508DRAFT_309456 [Ascobolus immersus RN42]|uniref:Uncharacterized protein n=1 Tax=Ascobolus immersus RN42 TaxID=1160509 RepID=A0A3N4I0H2_ASCIM|nr:hypothetical protein BJ508DRAFT_309456 [Ascobolus immersus RN42]